MLETGTKDFLALKRAGTLGKSTFGYRSPQAAAYPLVKVPVVIVFTKYDYFLDRVDRSLDDSSLVGWSEDAIKNLVKNKAEAEVRNVCIGPLEEFAGPDIPHATVSSEYHYYDHLIRAL